jgi:hypothetical protein
MTKYINPKAKERSDEPHPVWRGIGMVMMIGIPILSYAIANQLLSYFATEGIMLSEELMAPPVAVPLLGEVYNWPALLVFTFLIALVLFGLFAVVNAVVYSASSNSTLRKLESPPRRLKKKRKLIKPDYE